LSSNANINRIPWLTASLVVGLTTGGLLLGRGPVGGDPGFLYQPVKFELARALKSGRLPFWSDRLGLGVPLIAESHVAALYPPNWVLYRWLDVGRAYRWAMWLNYVALVASTFAYARCLGIGPWGAALAGLAFTLCGFQASHAVHEPFYYVLPLLPLCLLLADHYASTGRWGWLALLALAWGAQMTLGHFQIQFFTGCLVLVTGLWRVLAGRHHLSRGAGLMVGLSWGALIAAVQLTLTGELTKLSGFGRSLSQLSSYVLPPAHWVQLAFPGLFLSLKGGAIDPYWGNQLSTGAEGCFYLGVLPLILAFVGGIAEDRQRSLTPWRWIIPTTWLLACLPSLSPDAYWAITLVPGLGWFRAPARYTVLTSLGLAILAGRGFDRLMTRPRFRTGAGLAILFGLAAFARSYMLAQRPDLRTAVGADELPFRFAIAAMVWVVSLAVIAAWRTGKVGPWAPFAVAALELAILYRQAPSTWEGPLPAPSNSPTLTRLAKEPGVGLVMGGFGGLPAQAGLISAYPYLGITPPPPNYLLAHADDPKETESSAVDHWRRRFGVTHSIRRSGDNVYGRPIIFAGIDTVLDRLQGVPNQVPGREPWKVVCYPTPFPAAWVAIREVVTKADGENGWAELYLYLSANDAADQSWYIRGDQPAKPVSSWARNARVRSYDGQAAVVDHDGACDLIVRRTYYLGWVYRVDGGPEKPVSKVDGGLQGARIDGSGTSRVTFTYHPTGLRRWGPVSLGAMLSALFVAGISIARKRLTFSQKARDMSVPGKYNSSAKPKSDR
jgi:hypothetical protein